MRLLNTGTLALEEFVDGKLPPYAILSHRWGHEEVTFKDILEQKPREGHIWDKVKGSTALAAEHGFEYIWIDSCCINKESSAELSEAINSMFKWYQNAAVCYVHLFDVRMDDTWTDQFRRSDWFSRGWTLQELLAPTNVVFYSSAWHSLGPKVELCDVISKTTGIPNRALLGSTSLWDFSVAERLSWAAERSTTRIEDEAYCLLGLFNVNMPLLYGEGNKAFLRLQQEILRNTNDHSLFAWADPGTSYLSRNSLLARSPAHFQAARNLKLSARRLEDWYVVNDRSLQVSLPLVSIDSRGELWRVAFPTFNIYMVAIEDEQQITGSLSVKPVARRLARVSCDRLDFSPQPREVRVCSVSVPLTLDGLDPIHMRSLSALPASPPSDQEDIEQAVSLKEYGKAPYSGTVVKYGQQDCLEANIKNPPRPASVSAELPLSLSRRGTQGYYTCSYPSCGDDFLRHVDLRIHEVILHPRHEPRISHLNLPDFPESSRQSCGTTVNSENDRRPLLHREDGQSAKSSRNSSGRSVFSFSSASFVTNGTITPISLSPPQHEDELHSPQSSSDQTTGVESALSSACISTELPSARLESVLRTIVGRALSCDAPNEGPLRQLRGLLLQLCFCPGLDDTLNACPRNPQVSHAASPFVRQGSLPVDRGKTRKHSRHSHDGKWSEDDSEDEAPRKRRYGPAAQPECVVGEMRRLACPYFKHDPDRYSDRNACRGPGFQDVHRVKEHLYRRHARPIICLRCNETFASETALLVHSQLPNPCTPGQVTVPEGFTKDQEQRLRRRFIAPSEEAKWRNVYKILFPEIPSNQIPSPYYDARPQELQVSAPIAMDPPAGTADLVDAFIQFLQDPMIRSRFNQIFSSNTALRDSVQGTIREATEAHTDNTVQEEHRTTSAAQGSQSTSLGAEPSNMALSTNGLSSGEASVFNNQSDDVAAFPAAVPHTTQDSDAVNSVLEEGGSMADPLTFPPLDEEWYDLFRQSN